MGWPYRLHLPRPATAACNWAEGEPPACMLSFAASFEHSTTPYTIWVAVVTRSAMCTGRTAGTASACSSSTTVRWEAGAGPTESGLVSFTVMKWTHAQAPGLLSGPASACPADPRACAPAFLCPGLHYDALAVAAFEGAPESMDTTVIPSSGALTDMVMEVGARAGSVLGLGLVEQLLA